MPTPSPSFYTPGYGNVFVVPGATSLLQVEFSRSPNDFSFNDWVQVRADAEVLGYYPVIDTSDAVRVVNLDEFQWPDGQDMPTGVERPLRWEKYRPQRFAFPWTLGNRTIEAADYEVVATHTRSKATLGMTARSFAAVSAIKDPANWATSGSYYADLDAFGITGGSWFSSNSTTELFIQKSFHKAIRDVALRTGGAVGSRQLSCVVGPDVAHGMSETEELRAYMYNHESAMSNMGDQRQLPGYNLPTVLYGVRMVVEDAVRVTNRRESGDGSADTAEYMMGNSAAFVSRPGGLMGPEITGPNAAPSFSTVTAFVKEDMSVQAADDGWNRITRGAVVDDYEVVLTAPASGVFIDDVST